MRQPLYLELDGLKDSVVEIGILTNFKIHHLNEILLNGLNTHYANSFNLIPTRERKIQESGNTVIVESAICANNNHRVQITDDSIIFNMVDKYTRWANFSEFIYTCIEILIDYIDEITSVQIRYISTFEDTSIFDNLAGVVKLESYPRFAGSELNFQFGIAGKPSQHIRGSFAVVRLKNNIRIKNGDGTTSVVDVQVMTDLKNYEGKSRYVANLENIHVQEKNIFYSLLSDSFIERLKPHYDDK